MAYRDDVLALEARLAALTADVDVRVRERDELARLLGEARARADSNADRARAPRTRSRRGAGPASVLLIAGVAATIGIAVGNLSEWRPRESAAEIAKLAALTDEMCRCVERSCASRVDDEVTQWSSTLPTSWRAKLSDADGQRVAELDGQRLDCFSRTVSPGPRSKYEP